MHVPNLDHFSPKLNIWGKKRESSQCEHVETEKVGQIASGYSRILFEWVKWDSQKDGKNNIWLEPLSQDQCTKHFAWLGWEGRATIVFLPPSLRWTYSCTLQRSSHNVKERQSNRTSEKFHGSYKELVHSSWEWKSRDFHAEDHDGREKAIHIDNETSHLAPQDMHNHRKTAFS